MISPIKHIPYDILREIIFHVKYTPEMSYWEPSFEIHVQAPPIAASHVCRSWRHALLSDSTMWTCLAISEIKPHGIMELLRRSDSAPLNVFLQLNKACERGYAYKQMLDMLSTLFEQIHRFSVLRIQFECSEYVDPFYKVWRRLIPVIMSSIQRPAPMLQVFSFGYPHLELYNEFDPDNAVICNLFSGIAPNLRRVHHRLSLEFQESRCAAFSNLSELYLTPPFEMPFNPFLDLLEASPRLKLLHISTDLADVEINFDPSSNRKIHLPCLEKFVLKVAAAPQMLGLVMDHVTFPLTVKWYIHTLHRSDFLESPPLLHLLSQTRFTNLRARINQKGGYLHLAEDIEEDFSSEDQSNGNILVCEYSSMNRFANLWVPLSRAINSHTITRMVLQPNYLPDKCGITRFILAQMTGLQSLVIIPSNYSTLDTNDTRVLCLTALTPDLENMKENTDFMNSFQDSESDSDSEDSTAGSASRANSVLSYHLPVSQEVYCPLLRTVILRLCSPVTIKQAEIIAECLEVRREMGYPLGSIPVFCPSINKDAEQLLQRLELNDSRRVFVFTKKFVADLDSLCLDVNTSLHI